MHSSIRSLAAVLSIAILAAPTAAIAQTSTSLQQTPLSTLGPVPLQIEQAHTVYIAGAGADPNFPIDVTLAYRQFAASLQSWGRYQIVNSSEAADLVFQLRGVSPVTGLGRYDEQIYSIHSHAFELVIVDAKSGTPIWTVTSPFALAGKGQTRARWESLAVTNLVSRIKVLAGAPLTPVETTSLTTVPNYHHTRTILILSGAFVGLAAGGAILLHHEFENSLADQKASQDAFCTANHIPLSQCAGG